MAENHTGNVIPETTREEHQGNLNAKRVIVVDASGDQITSFGGSVTQYADGVARGTATGTLGMVDDGTNVQSMAGDVLGRPYFNAPYQDEIDRILTAYNIHYVFRDDFSKGFQGWQYQFDSTGRTGITLTEEARKGNYALQLHSRKVGNDEAWCRKGLRLPENLSKVVFGCYWTFHAINANNPLSCNFELDLQTASGTNRRYYAVRYLNHDGTTLLTKWQVMTGTPTVQAWTDVTSGAETIPWNEQGKPMLNYVVVVFDMVNNKYDKLYSNGTTYDLSALDGPTAGASLTNFNEGAVNLYRVVNRGNSTEEGIMTLEKTFLGYIYV